MSRPLIADSEDLGFVKGKGEGVYTFRLDVATGGLTPMGLTRTKPNPTYTATDKAMANLYVISEMYKESSALQTFRIDRSTGVCVCV